MKLYILEINANEFIANLAPTEVRVYTNEREARKGFRSAVLELSKGAREVDDSYFWHITLERIRLVNLPKRELAIRILSGSYLEERLELCRWHAKLK